MNPVKKFLLQLLAVYLVIALPIAFMFGPPGFSGDFLEEYQNDLDHYYEVVKSDQYKRWSQRPHIVESDPLAYTDAFAADVAFVQDFEDNAAFVGEMRRRDTFRILFNILNVGVAVALILRFGRKPLLDFLDKQVAEVRDRLDEAERARKEAKAARSEADIKMGSLAAETEVMAEQAHATAQETVSALEQETAQLMAAIDEELELRKRIEVQRAAMLLKAELVEAAGNALEKRLAEESAGENQRELITQFLDGLTTEGAAK